MTSLVNASLDPAPRTWNCARDSGTWCKSWQQQATNRTPQVQNSSTVFSKRAARFTFVRILRLSDHVISPRCLQLGVSALSRELQENIGMQHPGILAIRPQQGLYDAVVDLLSDVRVAYHLSRTCK